MSTQQQRDTLAHYQALAAAAEELAFQGQLMAAVAEATATAALTRYPWPMRSDDKPRAQFPQGVQRVQP